MKSHAITILIFILLFLQIVQPVAASPIDDGIDMVARGLERFVEYKAEQNLNQSFGVTFGDNGDMENITPPQRLVYMIGAAEQHPFENEDVRDTISTDAVWYYIFLIFAVLLNYLGCLIQETNPGLIASLSEKFSGHDGFYGSKLTVETALIGAFLPLAVFMGIDFLMTLEQLLSSGLMQDAMQYIQLSTKTVGIFFFESAAYASCGSMFAERAIYINFFCKHILKILILALFPLYSFKQFSKMLGTWFVSCLFARPLVLWYSSLAVEDIASKSSNAAMIAATAFDMSLVVIISFLTMLVLVLWPILNFIIKVITNYIMGAGFKLIRLNNNIQMLKRFRQ